MDKVPLETPDFVSPYPDGWTKPYMGYSLWLNSRYGKNSTGETHGGTTRPSRRDAAVSVGYMLFLSKIFGATTMGNAFHDPDNPVRPEDDPPWSVIQSVEYCDCQCTNCSGCLGL